MSIIHARAFPAYPVTEELRDQQGALVATLEQIRPAEVHLILETNIKPEVMTGMVYNKDNYVVASYKHLYGDVYYILLRSWHIDCS